MNQQVLHTITESLGENIQGFSPLSGGDINEVFFLKTTTENYVVKLNHANSFPKMFEAEANGLQLLAKHSSFVIPEVINIGEVDNLAFLVMSYIPSGQKKVDFSKEFALRLAELHQTSQENFGLAHNNYIGSLHQYNASASNASEFYIQQRLQPQFELAANNGFNFPQLEAFYERVSSLIPDEKPSLIHGDLWNGNHMVDMHGKPVLIDPAVAFAPREMDLAMMKLFGGYDTSVFEHYHTIFPLEKDWESRVELFQLYYLLVHLNLFGRSYLGAVESIIKKISF